MKKDKLYLLKTISFNLCVLLFFSNANAQATNADQIFNKINKIESQLKTLERGFYRNNTPPGDERPLILGQDNISSVEPRIANLEVHLNNLNKKMKNMRIDVLKLKKENDILRNRVSNLLDDIVKEVERQRDAETSGAFNNNTQTIKNNNSTKINSNSNTVNSTVNIQDKSTTSEKVTSGLSSALSAQTFEEELQDRISDSANSPDNAYEIAFSFIKSNDYTRAIKSFESFIIEFPKHKLASNAYYWMGESYYAQKNFKEASIKFLKGYNGFPQGRKAPDNLLKLGMSLGQIGQKENACKTFSKLSSEFPNAPAAIKQRLELERYRLYCP